MAAPRPHAAAVSPAPLPPSPQQAEGFETALRAYVQNCPDSTDNCFLGDTVDEAERPDETDRRHAIGERLHGHLPAGPGLRVDRDLCPLIGPVTDLLARQRVGVDVQRGGRPECGHPAVATER